jgi:hypothetical protein
MECNIEFKFKKTLVGLKIEVLKRVRAIRA